MDRAEFLEILRSQLSGQMQEGRAAAHLRYYEDYIQSQVRSGRSEAEVLAQLGDPRLIAKTLIDTDPNGGETVYESSDENYRTGADPQKHESKRLIHKLDLTTWYGKLIVIALAVLIVVVLVAIIGAILPFFIILAAVLFFISWLKHRK